MWPIEKTKTNTKTCNQTETCGNFSNFWQLRNRILDNICFLTIMSDTGQHFQFLRCLLCLPFVDLVVYILLWKTFQDQQLGSLWTSDHPAFHSSSWNEKNTLLQTKCGRMWLQTTLWWWWRIPAVCEFKTVSEKETTKCNSGDIQLAGWLHTCLVHQRNNYEKFLWASGSEFQTEISTALENAF